MRNDVFGWAYNVGMVQIGYEIIESGGREGVEGGRGGGAPCWAEGWLDEPRAWRCTPETFPPARPLHPGHLHFQSV